MGKAQPLVSILLPVYNCESFVLDAVYSVIRQTYKNIELIIIDDGSTDDTAVKLSTIIDGRMKYYRNNRNLGLSAALNRGVSLCNGEFIARLDADDICLPDRISLQVSFLANHPEYIMVGGSARCIDALGNDTGNHMHPKSENRLIKAALFFSCPMIHPTIMIRSSTLRLSGLNYRLDVRQAEDYVLYAELMKFGSFGNLKASLIKYRIHTSGSRITSDTNNADIVQGRMIAWRLLLAELQLETTDEVLLLHDKITYYRNRITASDAANYSSYIQLLSNMQQRNAAIGVFDRPTFDAEVAGRIYSTLILADVPVWDAFRQAYQQRNILGVATCIKLCLNKMRRCLLRMQ